MAKTFDELVAGANKIRTNELPESNTHGLVGEQILQMVNKHIDTDKKVDDNKKTLDENLKTVKENLEGGIAQLEAFSNDLFFTNGVNKNGTENTTVLGTPFIMIDKNFDVKVAASEAGSSYSPLNWYDKDLNFISNSATGTAGFKTITVAKADIPANAVYFRCSKNPGQSGCFIDNGTITYGRLVHWGDVNQRKLDAKIAENKTELSKVNVKKLSIGDLFCLPESLNKPGGSVTAGSGYISTPYILIDKTQPIKVGGYASASTTTYKLSPLNFYDKDFRFISYADNNSTTPNDTTGIKSFTLDAANIPANAVYLRAGASVPNQGTGYELSNGEMTTYRFIYHQIEDIKSIKKQLSTIGSKFDEKMEVGDLFFIQKPLTKDNVERNNATAISTPYILIDKTQPITVNGYTMASSTSTKLSALNLYDKDFNFIGYFDNDSATPIDTTGIKSFSLSPENIPSNAVYMKAGNNQPNNANQWLINGVMTYTRLFVSHFEDINSLKESSSNLDTRVSNIEEGKIKDIERYAEKYDTYITKREMYLRNKYKYDNDTKWYGVQWEEVDNPRNVIDIASVGDEALCDALPIQNKMRRCIIKDGVLQYYLHPDNSELKEDGSAAKLDGTDGYVMVEIPEFFYKFESTESAGIRTIKLKISENGIDGFSYSPKHYVGAYHATIDRDVNMLSTVCTTTFTRSEVELKTEEADVYIEGNVNSLGMQKLAVRSGFTNNAVKYRGGHPDVNYLYSDPVNGGTKKASEFDVATNPANRDFCLNKLGVAVAQVQRAECRAQSRMWLGETMYLYDTQRALWILTTVEFKTRNIQDPINKTNPRDGGLGWGATVYPHYNAYEAFFSYRGTACVPNGVTNNLGNKSGEVYYRMPNVPVEADGTIGNVTYTRFANVLIPVLSYRGVENFYGHLYSAADQITLSCLDLVDENRRVNYYYQRNPFRCKTDIADYEHIGQYEFEATIKSISSIIGGLDGHILPIKTVLNHTDGYCDCSEIGGGPDANRLQGISYNGRLVSRSLVGRNFLVSFWKDNEGANRASESVRQCQFIL